MLPSFCEVLVREERVGNGFVVEGWCEGDKKKIVWPADSDRFALMNKPKLRPIYVILGEGGIVETLQKTVGDQR